MEILIKLLIAHLLTDFVLQPDSWIEQRNTKHYKAPELYYHGVLTSLVAWGIIGEWKIVLPFLFILVSHTLIDLWKSYRKDTFLYFMIDQILHVVCIIVAWYYIQGGVYYSEMNLEKLKESKYLIYILGFLISVFPIGYIIRYITLQWQEQIENKGLPKAGMWIGWTERALIFVFVIVGQFSAIAFLLTAKSIYRFVDLKDENDRKKAEYILIGTLLSFTFSICIAVICSSLAG